MMRPLLPIVMLCGACGDNLLVSEEQGPAGDPSFEQAEVFFAPDVCSVRTWPTVEVPDHDVDLSVVPMSTGAAIFTVERSGGPLRGFTIDGRGELDTKIEGTTIRDDQAFTAVAGAFVDERLIATSVTATGLIEIDMIRPDLGEHVTLSHQRGTFVADMAHAREDRFATIGSANGLTGIRFAGDWKTQTIQPLASSTIRSMTATRYFDDTVVAYSSDDTCTLNRVSAEHVSTRNYPCLNSRLALSQTTRTGYMVHENKDQDKVMISELLIGGHSEIANTRVLVEAAHAPKIIYDGVRFWVSYVNVRDDIVIGYINAKGDLVSMALEGTQPLADAYDLAFLGGAVWIFSVDDAGAGAQRLCLKPVR